MINHYIAIFKDWFLIGNCLWKKDEQDNEIYHYIDDLIFNFLSNKDNIPTLTQSYKTHINDKLVEINIWFECIDNDLIQIFEIRTKSFLFETVYAKGILFNKTGYQIIDNQQLWAYGFWCYVFIPFSNTPSYPPS